MFRADNVMIVFYIFFVKKLIGHAEKARNVVEKYSTKNKATKLLH
jgi:hypothetical protein